MEFLTSSLSPSSFSFSNSLSLSLDLQVVVSFCKVVRSFLDALDLLLLASSGVVVGLVLVVAGCGSCVLIFGGGSGEVRLAFLLFVGFRRAAPL